MLERGLRGEEHAAHVDVQHAVEFLDGRLLERLRDRRPGVIDQDVESAESRDRFFDGGLDRLGIGGVRLERDGFATPRLRSP